jgi:hypothetical protein
MSVSSQLTLATLLLGLTVALSIGLGAWSHLHPRSGDALRWSLAIGLALAPGVILLDRLARRRWRALSTPRFPAA